MEKDFEYYLQVLRIGEQPQWPIDEAGLDIGSQSIGSDYIQFWAYPKELEMDSQEVAPAEKLAGQNPTAAPTILIDQVPDKSRHFKDLSEESSHQVRENILLNLILVYQGHAWSKVESSLRNLEDNLNSILEYAKDKYDLDVEHFMTTSRVSSEVEHKLSQIENADEANREAGEVKRPAPPIQTEHTAPPLGFRQVNTTNSSSMNSGMLHHQSSPANSNSNRKITIILVLFLILVVAGVGGFIFREKIMTKISHLQGKKAEVVAPVVPTPTSLPTPTPTPAITRADYKVRILNGTTKTGAASTLADLLKGLGWNVVKTGNATAQDKTQTEVKFKTGSEVVAATMVSDLSKQYQATSSATLSKKDTADVEVIIGKQ